MIKFIATMYTKTVFVPCTIGAICLHFFSGEQRQVESKMGPLGVCLSLYAYFELAFAHLKNKKRLFCRLQLSFQGHFIPLCVYVCL